MTMIFTIEIVDVRKERLNITIHIRYMFLCTFFFEKRMLLDHLITWNTVNNRLEPVKMIYFFLL